MSALNPTWTFLIRNWKSGELQLIAFAIFISVACISSVVFLTTGLHSGLADRTGAVLGGDRGISSPNPIEQSIIKHAEKINLETTETLSFTGALLHGSKFALADVEAVKENYPLRGELRAASKLYVPDEAVTSVPTRGTIWLESRLFPSLNIHIGDTLTIGMASFKVTRVLTAAPSHTLQGFAFAPRVLMNYRDVKNTQIVQPGSHTTYKLLVAGKSEPLKQFETWVTPRLKSTQSFLDARNSRPIIKAALDRVEKYLGLVFVINVTLAGVAIAMVSRRFSERQFDTVAILRCLGAENSWIFARYLFSILLLGLIAGILGVIFGYGSQFLLARVYLFKELFSYATPDMIGLSTGISLFTVFILLFGFAFPPLFNLRKVPPLRVLRRDLNPPQISSSLIVMIALIFIAGLLLLQTRNITLSAIMIAAMVGISLVVVAVIYVLLKGAGEMSHFLNVLTQLSMRNVARRSGRNAFQVLAFSLVISFAITLFLVRIDLLQTWKNQIPEKAHNYFVINIPSDSVTKLKTFFQDHGIDTAAFYPTVLSRLTEINKTPVKMHFDITPSANTMNRLVNLTWSLELQSDNQIVEGTPLSEKDIGHAVASIEQGFASLVGIKLGDKLKFQTSHRTISSDVTSIRKVEWDSFHPNFFVIFPPGVLEQEPATFVTSFYVSPSDLKFLGAVIKQFPMVSIIDSKIVLSQIKNFLETTAGVVQYLWGFTVITSFILLFAAIYSTLDQRSQEALLLRILGISNRKLWWVLLSEFLLLGLLAGVVAVFSAEMIVYWLSNGVFNLPYHLNKEVLVVGPIIGMLLVGLGGFLGTLRIFLKTPAQLNGEYFV